MEFKKKEPLIILIAGKARSGKSTLAEHLKDYYTKEQKKVVMSPYAKYLKYYIAEIIGKDIDDENKPRDLLQQISSKIIKGELGKKNFFIDRQLDDLQIFSYFADVIIIPDVRFPEEIRAIRKANPNVMVIGVKRLDYVSNLTVEQQQDITETSLDDYKEYDYVVENTKNTDLAKEALKIVKKQRKEHFDE